MNETKLEQCTTLDDYIDIWIESFLKDRIAWGAKEGTLYFYRFKLGKFSEYCHSRMITKISQIEPDTIREYLFYLRDNDHNYGGRKAFYRALKTFLKWFWSETEPPGRNPIERVKMRKERDEPLEPVTEREVRAILKTCKDDIFSLRDRAIILVLLDTGARAEELIQMNRSDYDPREGRIIIKRGKGDKSRSTFVSPRTRRALLQYLKQREDTEYPLWLTKDLNRITYWGIRDMITRRSRVAEIDPPTLHAFRRAFAINSLRSGMDIYTLAKLMGHADIQVLRRYLKLVDEDLRIAHRKTSVVEKWEL